jgi:hypothetical protein
MFRAPDNFRLLMSAAKMGSERALGELLQWYWPFLSYLGPRRQPAAATNDHTIHLLGRKRLCIRHQQRQHFRVADQFVAGSSENRRNWHKTFALFSLAFLVAREKSRGLRL